MRNRDGQGWHVARPIQTLHTKCQGQPDALAGQIRVAARATQH